MDSVEPMQVDDPESGSAPPSDFIVDPPNFDLEGYANSYEGLAKVRRLMFVAKHCPSLQVDALRCLGEGDCPTLLTPSLTSPSLHVSHILPLV